MVAMVCRLGRVVVWDLRRGTQVLLLNIVFIIVCKKVFLIKCKSINAIICSQFLQRYQLVAAHGQVSDADPSLLPDELGHGLKLLLTHIYELPPVINNSSQEPICLQLHYTVNGLLGLQMELGGKVLQQHNLQGRKRCLRGLGLKGNRTLVSLM